MSPEKDKIHDIPLPFDNKYDVKCSDIKENIDIDTLKGISNKKDGEETYVLGKDSQNKDTNTWGITRIQTFTIYQK